MPISYQDVRAEDLQDANLRVLNDILQRMAEEVNRLGGSAGRIVLLSDIDMSGNLVTNIGAARVASDALSKDAAGPLYGAAVVRKQVESTGNEILATTRRINDQTQREQYSTFLNSTASTPPVSNTSTVSVVAAGANSTVTVTAGVATFADGSMVPYAARVDTVANPGAGNYFYYYYLRASDHTLQTDGPYTTNTSQNQFNSNKDGRAFIGTATINVGGGGTGGGGGGGTGGCTEVGTPLKFFPGANPTVQIVPCSKWYCFELQSGEVLKCAENTLVSVFIPVQFLAAIKEFGRVERTAGSMAKVKANWEELRDSQKQVVKEPVNGTYLANGVRVHNVKPISG